MENQLKCSLWNKESKKGTTYASGKTTIEGKQYRITLFVNNNNLYNQQSQNQVVLFHYFQPQFLLKNG